MFNGKEYNADKIMSLCQCDEVIEKPFDSQSFLTKIENLKSKVGVIYKEPEEAKSFETDFFKDLEVKGESIDKSLDLDFGEEFTIKEKDKKIDIEELDLSEIEQEELEELEDLEELKDIEDLEVEELKIDENIMYQKDELGETVTLEDLLGEEVIMEEVSEEKDISEKKPVEKALEEPKIDINEFFSDLNEILLDKEKTPSEKIFEEKKVKPVVEEVAKELKEMEEIVSSDDDLDIWDFEVPAEESKEPIKETPSAYAEEKKFDLLSLDKKELEKIIKEITYEVIEKVAWEVVPEIVDTILKDKFPKR